METSPGVGFQTRHANWLVLGGTLLTIGVSGLISLVICAKTVTNFKADRLFFATLSACCFCALTGLYTVVAVFADWPLPEPGPKTRRVWRLGALIICALVCIALLYFLQGLFFRYVSVAVAVVVGAFILAALLLIAYPTDTKLSADLQALPAVAQDILAEEGRDEDIAGMRETIDALTQQVQLFTRFGIVHVFETRGVTIRSEYDRRLSKARENVDVLGFGLQSLLKDYREAFAEWKTRAHIRILLLDPSFPSSESSFADVRDVEERNQLHQIRNEVEQFIEQAGVQCGASAKGSFNIRLYRAIPTINMFRIDDSLFWGPYLMHSPSRNEPTILVERGVLYDRLVNHFNVIWYSNDLSKPFH